MNKVLTALNKVKIKKDNIPVERLEIEMLRETLFLNCERYLTSPDLILEVQIAPNAIDAALASLHSEKFLEKYEFQQYDEDKFRIKMREYNIL